MQLLKPKFKYGLFLIKESNNKYNNQDSNTPIICYADAYEINDGVITFFHTAKIQTEAGEKKVKVAALSYPAEKWGSCVLIDNNNAYPVFENKTSYNPTQSQSQPQKITQIVEEQQPDISDLDLFNNLNDATHTHDINEITQTQQTQPQNYHQKNYHSHNQPFAPMPGINNNNPVEFKKQKTEWLESHIKQYSKQSEIEQFIPEKFLKTIQKDNDYKKYKPSENDIIWASVELIKTKQVIGRKFSDANTQKILSLLLPDIMKRQWNGKLNPILEILSEKEETKNVTAADFMVWLVNNNIY